MRTLMMALAVATTTGGCALAAATPAVQAVSVDAPVAVTVERDGDRWTADFVLNRDAPVWFFQRSALLRVGRTPWRPATWTVETPGVILDRQGRYDVLRTVDGGPVPREVRVRLRPSAGDLEADYDPALIFSDGAVALYSGQFDVSPLASVDQVRALPLDLNGIDLPGGPAEVTWRDRAGPVLFKGERLAEVTALDADTYVLFGDARTREGQGVTTVIDPGLPTWLGDQLGGFTPLVMDFYASRLGPQAGPKPTLMVSWTGPTESLSSMGGSVLPGLISMNFEGEGVLNPEPAALARARWFIGHESAHFWLGSSGLKYQYARDAWITEGGADLMAVRAISAIDPSYDALGELQREVDDCVSFATGQPIASAGERGDNRAYYACGAVWALALEGARRERSGGDIFDVIADLQRRNADDGVLTREEWLEALTRESRDRSLRIGIERMLDVGSDAPASEIARLFDRTGVAFRMFEGRVVLEPERPGLRG
ncbi:hypothetical protein BZG35_12245 [Brevundimonas sp. LM2]|uniref:hypothetical protein n=1 Tax=Brevundimonas sp. LM2 TaxID=1938605 RepID=UPI00098406E8|nr:hypothetical protein [Brevundimonas sp. LM2]AQR62328.1 hypothetical protein BZG35_12245 [Brevundimonas sp. LM2]